MSLLLAAKGAKQISIPDINASSVGVDIPQVATVTFTSSGGINYDGGAANKWYAVASAGVGSEFEIFATVVSGSFSAGTFAVWQSLGTNRAWSVTANSLGAVNGVANYQIRRAGESSVIAVGEIEFLAEVIS